MTAASRPELRLEPPTGAWTWRCEDEYEAHGLELVLSRAGVPVERKGAHELCVPPETSEQAERLTAAILGHHAQAEARDRAQALRRRESAGRRVLVALAAVGLGLSLVALLASF